jgi:hypothetical protein
MTLRSIIFGLCLWFSAGNLIAQAISERTRLPLVLMGMGSYNDFEHSGPMSSWAALSNDAKSNMVFTVNTPKPCPLEYTNIISNTNLFSLAEQKLLAEIPLEYKNMTTNSGPSGTVFVGFGTLNSPIADGISISQFRYTNSNAQLKMFFYSLETPTEIVVSFRTKSGDGYDALFSSLGMTNGGIFLRQFKQNQLDGLWVDFKGDHCADCLRFKDGKAIGKWLVWNQTGSLYMEAEFKQPYDFIGHLK